MAELFENFVDDIGLIPKLKIAREKYLNELRAEVRAEVREEVRAEVREEVRAEVHEEVRAEGRTEGRTEGIEIGQERLRRLTKTLIEQNRLKDLERSARDSKFMEEMFREFHI